MTVDSIFTYPDTVETVKKVIIDTPAGGVGNPNAVPYADRCTTAQFETAVCPPASQIGTVSLLVTLRANTAPPRAFLAQFALTGTVSIIQTTPEVPTTVGAYIVPPAGPTIRSYATFYPVTSGPDGDFRIRSVTADFPTTALGLPIQIDRYQQTLKGVLPSGVPFITNPTRCDTWYSYGYGTAVDSNTNANSDPLMTGNNEFVKTEAIPTTPDCSTLAPFPISGATTISSPARDISPAFDFTISDPGLAGLPIGSDSPRKIVTTVPASINVDVQQLGRICENAQFNVDQCPVSTKVGTVAIETPLIQAGLQGDIYLTRSEKNVLPDLGMWIRGAITFSQRGSNHYVNTNQIQTTFDDIPQAGFTKLTVHLFGGNNGLLRTLACPKNNRRPSDGPITYRFYGWGGLTAASDSTLKTNACWGIVKLRTFGCVYRLLRFQPTYTSRTRIRRVVLYIDGRKTMTVRKLPFQFRKSVRKYKKGKHKFKVRAFYDDGTVAVKNSRFKRC